MSKQISKVEDLRNSIEKLKPQIKAALPSHVTVEKFSRVLMTALSSNKDLQDANRTSLFASCLKLAALGLMPDGSEAAIVTFKKDGEPIAQPMPMIRGILKLVRNSGEISSLTSQIVHEHDKFRFWVDADGEHIEHEPLIFGDRGARIGTYAIAKTKDGDLYVEFMSTKQIEDVKSSSRSAKYGPWSGKFEDEMWRKTVLRRLSKRLPMSTDLETAVKADDDMYDLNNDPATQETEAPAPVKTTKPKKLKDIIETQAVESEPEPMPEVEDAPI